MRVTIRLKEKVTNYIKENAKEYALVALLFIIGLLVGVMIVNNCGENQIEEISKYIQDFSNKFKNTNEINKTSLIMQSIKNNTILAIILWLAGTTVIGIPIVLIAIFLRGMFLGYTISVITYTYGAFKGILFCILSMVLQNILFIPAVLTLGVSSIKLYKSIIKDRRKENIKIGIFKHTITSLSMLIILLISSLVENLVSMPILQNWIKYF